MSTIKKHVENKIATLTIDREAQLNALNRELLSEISKALDEWQEDPDIRVVILTGSGTKAFAAGADIKEFAEYDTVAGTELSRYGQVNVFDKIEFYPKPIIAAINGYALGGGLELALACHMRVASHNAKFGLPESNLGLIPGYGGTQRLPQIVGKSKAYAMLFSGNPIDTDVAFQYGLISAQFSLDELLSETINIASEIASKSPLVLQKLINCVNSHYYDDGRDGYEVEIKSFGASFGTEDAKEGIQAFLEKRKPDFKGI